MNKFFLLLNILIINATTHSMMQYAPTRSQEILAVVSLKPALYFEVNSDDLIINHDASYATKDDKTLWAYCTQLELNVGTFSDPLLRKKLAKILTSNQYDQKLLEQALDELKSRGNVKIKTRFHSRYQLTRADKSADLCATLYWMRKKNTPSIEVKITSVQENNPDLKEDLDQSYARAIAFSNQYGLIVPNGY